jgi:hypothetical protein
MTRRLVCLFLSMAELAPLALAQAPPAIGRPLFREPSAFVTPSERSQVQRRREPTFTESAAPGIPQSLVPIEENLLTFDDRLAELQWNQGRWELWASGLLLKDFGRHEHEARQALRIVRDLRLTQLGTVGTPRPMMEYWLSEGRAPRGVAPGLRPIPIDQATLHTEQVQGYWCVRDTARVLFNFGTHREEAEQALGIMRRYGFVQAATLGAGTPLMLIFLGPESGLQSTELHTPPPPPGKTVAARQMTTTEFPSVTEPNQIARHAPLRPAKEQPPSDTANPALGSTGRQLASPGLPLADQLPLIERVPLDVRQVRLVQQGKDWKLVCGNYLIANFGADERDALRGESLFHTYRFTEQCLVGRPKPVFSFFLTKTGAPHGLTLGLCGISFVADRLALKNTEEGWEIGDNGMSLIRFGDKAEEAKQTLKAIQRYQFDTLCRLGSPKNPAMTVLLRTR